ncbi:S-adenosyl-L-methionine-dependent methyltransferase [Exophiala viscosa]|uniref:S-adenosyl-L-methionine-dependent methyltransferase n=1 Tax=Exophiala viscosa TaxID=2486360 RepID=A0AAN6DT05_9EURO|nr:S-adenosyl-L-methionine-dependent methyltransferase [Exophiala viscosa]
MPASEIAHSAQAGFAPAKAYDAHRPSYPEEAVEQFLQKLEIAGVKGAKVADLAAGTGKFTEILARRPEEYDVVAIEPHDGMRGELDRKTLPRVSVVKGTANSMSDIPDESLACLFAAQAFHWFANMDALKEIARVLQPTGVFGGIWNIEDYNSPKSWEIHPGWESTMRDVVWTFDDNQPRFRHEKWREVFDEQNRSNPLTLHFADPLFGLPVGERSVDFETWLSKDDVWARLRTLSQIAVLEGDELEKVKKMFFDSVNSPDTETDEHGRVAVHGRTVFFWTSKIPAEPLKSGG